MQTKGFTLIELVVVIVILGILSATVLPKFINIKPEAQTATLKGVSASIEGAAALVYGKALIAGNHKDGPGAQVTLSDGTVVDIAWGYPIANGIQWNTLIEFSDAFASEDFTTDGSFLVYLAENNIPVNATKDCVAYYLPPTAVGQKPIIGVNDCT